MNNDLIKAIETYLDTRDKRYMFLLLEFKEVIPYINLEGTPNCVAWSIATEFKNRGKISNLVNIFNSKLGTNIVLQ